MSAAALTIKPYTNFADAEQPEKKKRRVALQEPVQDTSIPPPPPPSLEPEPTIPEEEHEPSPWVLAAGALSGVLGFILVHALLK